MYQPLHRVHCTDNALCTQLWSREHQSIMRNTFHHLPYDGRTVVGSRGEPSAVVREPHVLHLISMLLSSFHAASSACISRRMNPHPPAMWPHLPNGSRALFEVPRKTYGPATTACSLLWLNTSPPHQDVSLPPTWQPYRCPPPPPPPPQRPLVTSQMAAVQSLAAEASRVGSSKSCRNYSFT